jgi:hypothetical protein
MAEIFEGEKYLLKSLEIHDLRLDPIYTTFTRFSVPTIGKGVTQTIRLFKVEDLPIIRHIKVRGKAHTYDPFHAEYFEQRRNRQWLRRKRDGRFLAIPAIARMA